MTARLLLASDFDGTLAAICNDPGGVVIDPAFAALFRSIPAIPDIETAIISGRDIDDLATRVGGVSAYLAGSHGLEIRSPGGNPLRTQPPLVIDLDPSIESEARALGVRIERKKHALALHWREARGIDLSHPLISKFCNWGRDHHLDLIEGRRVVEARSPGGGKEDTLRYLADRTGAREVIYAGDDLTDFDALRFAATRGHAYFMASDERQPPAGVTVVRSREELLTAFQEALGREDGGLRIRD
jgi:trehalose-phosphatase